MPLGIDSVFDSISDEIRQSSREGIRAAAPIVVSAIHKTFDAEGKRGDNPEWTPTTDVALRNRVNATTADSPGWKTLHDTGRLRKSIAFAEIEPDGPDLVGYVEPGEAYALDMEEGSVFVDPQSGQDFDVPARPFMFVTREDADMVTQAVAEALP